MPAPDEYDGYSYRNGLPLGIVIAVVCLLIYLALNRIIYGPFW